MYYQFMPFGKSVESSCNECGLLFPHLKKLSEHLKKEHQMTSIEYVIKYNHQGVRPSCKACGGETRFVSLGDGFKLYCTKDRKIAESEAGRQGGRIKKTWSKGKTKETDERVATLAKRVSGSGNHFFGKKHSDETKTQIADKKRLSWSEIQERVQALNVKLNSKCEDYVDQNSQLHITCNNCGTDSHESLLNLQRCWRCRVCFPIGSRQQLEVAEYVRTLGFDVEVSTRRVIPPLEIDVWVPEKRLAIEYHGLYWHSGGKNGVFDKGRHRQKYETCAENQIRLMQFFSDEWINRTETCKSMIRNALGLNEVKLNARDCEVREISSYQSKPFLEDNHVAGATRAKQHLGLFHPTHGLVSVATIRIPIQKKWGNVSELARMCSKRGLMVRGGASKLLRTVVEWSRVERYDGVLSYAELRYGDGNVYEKCGFKLVGSTLNNYWYTDGVRRFDRFKFRAQSGMSEKEVAENAKVRAVWGSGNNVYVLRFT